MGVAGMIKVDVATAPVPESASQEVIQARVGKLLDECAATAGLPPFIAPINTPMPLVNSKEDRAAAVALIDSRIRERATKAVVAAQRYAELAAGGGDDMTAEERRIAQDAGMSDREVPFGLKLNLRVFESFRKSDDESERPSLAIQINFGGTARSYPVIKVEGNK